MTPAELLARLTELEAKTWFEKHVAAAENGCWQWSGAKRAGHYVRTSYRMRSWLAHRLAWHFVNGPIPVGLFVCHRCDNKHCINPEHLFLGTHADNMRDMIAKNRHPKERNAKQREAARRSMLAILARGSCRRPKLCEAEVLEIRSTHGPQRETATRFGVSQTLISQIRRGLIWKRSDAALARWREASGR